MRIKNINMIPSGSVSINANATLDGVALDHITHFSIQVVFSGTSPSGTFKLQCSNDDSSTSNWTDIGGSSQTVKDSGNVTWNVENAGYKWVRVVFTHASGTGNITSARCHIKGV